MPRPLFTPGKDPVPIVQEAGWTTRPVWTGAENIAPTGIRSPDRPDRSQSLYQLSYPAHDETLRKPVFCPRVLHDSQNKQGLVTYTALMVQSVRW